MARKRRSGKRKSRDKSLPRKSPHKHKVKTHKRQGKTINSYERGKGRKPSSSRARKPKKVVVGKKRGKIDSPFSYYDVKIEYSKGRKEVFKLNVDRYDSALSLGLSKRRSIEDPKKVTLRGLRE